MTDYIRVIRAREHNLRNVTVDIPKGKITLFTGPSGSGKSSLVFDTIAAESQRQLNDTFPAFVRNRLPHYGQPDADAIQNLTVAIVVDQRPLGTNSRSTVGTATEIHTLLRLLFSRAGTPHVGSTPYFSFNDPRGMCERCQGLGMVTDINLSKLIDRSRSLDDGAITFPTFAPGTWRWKRYALAGFFDREKPLKDFTREEWDLFLYTEEKKPDNPQPGFPSTGVYEGLLPRFRRSYITVPRDSLPPKVRDALEDLVEDQRCPVCGGARLNAAALACSIGGQTIATLSEMEAEALLIWVRALEAGQVATVRDALLERLSALVGVGLGYLSLNRPTPSLSGGEAQRVKMVRHLGSSLTGITYVLDEPSSGLHPADIARLGTLMREIRDKGNTVLVVEHDLDVIGIADHVIDLGPAAGRDGGRIVFQGGLGELRGAGTATGRALRGRAAVPDRVRVPAGWVRAAGLRANNLADVSVAIPLGVLTAVTGVAGSGKSTLVREALSRSRPGVRYVDQSVPPGSRRSTLATYLGIGAAIRKRFAAETRVPAALFSANSDGACPECNGLGFVEMDLAFMDTVRTTCESCGGRRFSPEALSHRLRGRTIADVLGMTAADAAGFFAPDLEISASLRQLDAVGLGYLALGQPVSTLSGGERQRLKLSSALDDPAEIYVLDEPTTGSHSSDISRMLRELHRIVDSGRSVVVIEHEARVIACADWVIDMGPGAGHQGGRVMFEGAPADLLNASTPTALHLRRAVS
jgi:excinuclease UvrABC ATPase subunit